MTEIQNIGNISFKNLKPEAFKKKETDLKQKFMNWIKDPYNRIFLGILALGIIIRIFYFILTKDQAIWWDESDYLAYAKNLAGLGGDWVVAEKHNSLYPFLVAGLFLLGIEEALVKFILQIIPSILTILLVYLISNEMYKDKRIGLAASFLMATFWVVLFNSMRFHIGITALFTGLLAIYVFWRGYENKKKIFNISPKWAIPMTVFLVILTYTIRRGYFLFGLFILVYLLSTKNWKDLIKDKYNWIGIAIAGALFFIAEKFIFISKIGSVGQSYFNVESAINLLPFNIFASFFKLGGVFQNVLFYLLWFGLVLLIIDLFLKFGYIRKNKESKSNLFNVLTIFLTLFFFIYVLRAENSSGNFGDPRWYLPLAMSSLICISKGAILISDKLKKYGKFMAILVLVLLIGFGGYTQYAHGGDTIKSKVDSFSGIKEAGLFIKEISNEEDIIISIPRPQPIYYSGRKIWDPKDLTGFDGRKKDVSLEMFLEAVEKNPNVKYLFVSFSEPNHPEWMKRQTSTSWEIPFMETKIDFALGKQDIKQSKSFGEITFNLLEIKQDVFIYEITRA